MLSDDLSEEVVRNSTLSLIEHSIFVRASNRGVGSPSLQGNNMRVEPQPDL